MAQTIAAVTQSLADDFHVVPLQLRDAPIFMACALPIWDGVTGLKPRLPAGRGLTLQHSLLTAAAEAVELRASLAQNHRAAIAGLATVDGQKMVTAHDLLDGQAVQVPAQSVYLDFAAMIGEPLITDADSTGCAAGDGVDAAIEHALQECIERDAVALWWYGAQSCPSLPIDIIDRAHPRLVWWLHQRVRQTRLLDLTTDIAVPVVLAMSCLPDGSIIATGSAARDTLAGAALAAITEMIQTETAMQQPYRASDAVLSDWINRACAHDMVQFRSLPPKPPFADTVLTRQKILQTLGEFGHRALVVELSLPDDPLPTVRVIVRGLCAMGGRLDAIRFEKITKMALADLHLTQTGIFEPF